MRKVDPIRLSGYPRKPVEPARACKTWTDPELDYLKDNYGLIPRKTLASNLQRTEGTVRRASRVIHQRVYDNFYTAQELARVLAVHSGQTIVSWVQRGWLKGRRSTYYRGPHRLWLFTEEDVVRCLRERPWLVNLKKLPEHIFRSIVREEWERDPWLTAEEVAPMVSLKTTARVHRLISLGWLPADRKPGGVGVWIIRRSTVEEFLANDPRPQHRHDAIKAARLKELHKKGRPARLAMVWQLQCPRCGAEVRITAPPDMFGAEVRERFINIYINGACSHGAMCRIRQPFWSAGEDKETNHA